MRWVGIAKSKSGITYINHSITKYDLVRTVRKKKIENKKYRAIPIDEVAMSFFIDDVLNRLQTTFKNIEFIKITKVE